MKEFLKGLFSIGEHKTSTIVCTFMVLMGFVIYVFVTGVPHTIDGNVKDIIICFILTIGSVNGVQSVGDIIQTKNQFKSLENPQQDNQPSQKPQ